MNGAAKIDTALPHACIVYALPRADAPSFCVGIPGWRAFGDKSSGKETLRLPQSFIAKRARDQRGRTPVPGLHSQV
jgi:hypothetical protein